MDFRFNEDILLVIDVLSSTKKELASQLDISVMTLDRWLKEASQPRPESLDRFYNYAFNQAVNLNAIKAQLYHEELDRIHETLLFHGSKSGIKGNLSLNAARPHNDFGQGFYCGENLQQSAMFVTSFPHSSLYMIAFDSRGLQPLRFTVSTNWMLAIASFRGRLAGYNSHPLIQQLRQQVKTADYVIAPIADNRMYEVIDSFIDGEITDLQCEHSLSATNLGQQYVFTSERSLEQLRILEHCYLCSGERAHYELQRNSSSHLGLTKAKAARRQYRGQGRYIEELLS